MWFSIDGRLREEARRYQLRSACRDCFNYVQAEGRCAHGWPNDSQKNGVAEVAASGDTDAGVSFCKEFELG